MSCASNNAAYKVGMRKQCEIWSSAVACNAVVAHQSKSICGHVDWSWLGGFDAPALRAKRNDDAPRVRARRAIPISRLGNYLTGEGQPFEVAAYISRACLRTWNPS